MAVIQSAYRGWWCVRIELVDGVSAGWYIEGDRWLLAQVSL